MAQSQSRPESLGPKLLRARCHGVVDALATSTLSFQEIGRDWGVTPCKHQDTWRDWGVLHASRQQRHF
eukprot:12904117-Prorocentrum_lima.AAC.1